ncbi:MAG: hypothetical protein ABEK50_10475 [bacterium]
MSMEEKLELRVDDSFLKITDHVADNLGTNRSNLVRNAIEDYLKKQIEENDVMKEIIVENYLDGEVAYAELQKLFGFEDAQAIKVTKEAYDRSDEIVSDIAEEL